MHLVLPLRRHRLEKLQNIFLTQQPDQLRQLAPAKVVLVTEEHRLEPRLFKGTNHRERMPDQVDVTSFVEVAFGTPENLEIESIRWRLVDQHSVAQPALHERVELLR